MKHVIKPVISRLNRQLRSRSRHWLKSGTAAGASVAWLSVACACTLEPRYRAPALPVPDQWPMPATTPERSGVNVAARDIGWGGIFLGTRPQQLIRPALA